MKVTVLSFGPLLLASNDPFITKVYGPKPSFPPETSKTRVVISPAQLASTLCSISSLAVNLSGISISKKYESTHSLFCDNSPA